ncbi:MAG: hypothetical protein R2706_06145 [Acidimicrobiales bacterium]
MLRSYVASKVPADVVDEIVVALPTPTTRRSVRPVDLTASVDGLLGRHPTMLDGLRVQIDQLLEAASHQRDVVAPRHKHYVAARSAVIGELRRQLQVDDLTASPRALSAIDSSTRSIFRSSATTWLARSGR